jgi:parallel beta-helix repeat protein
MQSVVPKNGDIFSGTGSVILNGSQVLSFKVDPAGSGLWVANATANTFFHGTCQTAYPLCGYTQDLFIDNALQTPTSNTQGLTPGSWYFDLSNNTVYVPHNPAGRVVELGMQSYAFYGSATGVQVNRLTVEKYANPAQYGAIGDHKSGTGWIVDHVESRWNHGAGIELGSGSQISNSYIHHNGQLGIAFGGTNCVAINNEISWNNYAGFDTGWKAGGSKFWATSNLAVQSNYVHDNKGPGLWTDTDNVGTQYENNTVVNNLNEGIKHEVSFNAIIRNNTVEGNGNTPTVWLWNAQIELQASSNVEVYGNTVEVSAGGGNGIALINENRGTGTLGAYVAANNNVHDNTITYLGTGGRSGIVDSTTGNTAVGNRFDYNHYILQNGGKVHWDWFSGMDWKGLLAVGQETHGNCCN